MPPFGQIDWRPVFTPSLHFAEIFVRGSILYLFLFFLLRIRRREAAGISIADLLLVVLIADAAQNAMSSDYRSIPEGLCLVSTIAFWDLALDWAAYRYPAIRRFVQPSPLPLIKNGRIVPKNLRRELISEDELLAQLRKQGVDRIEEVKESYMEGDGQISVVRLRKDDRARGRRQRIP